MKLEKIDIPNGVEDIKENAFQGCGLVECNFGNKLKYIRQEAFLSCKLKNIFIPKSVELVHGWAFLCGDYVESIQVEKGNPIYDSRDNCNAIIGTKDNFLYMGCKNTVIPNQVKTIGSRAFFNVTSLRNINIPNSVFDIYMEAFYGCLNLKKITFETIKILKIKEDAFKLCENINEVHIPNLSDWYYLNFANGYSNPLSNGFAGLYVNGQLQNKITLPKNVNAYTFYGYNGLNEVTIPNNILSIGDDAFKNCNNLISVVNKSDLDIQLSSTDYGYIASQAMIYINKDGDKQYIQNGYEYIETDDGFLIGQQNDKYFLFAYLGDEETLVIPNKIQGHNFEIIKIIGNYKNLVLPNGMKTITSRLFQGYFNLISVVLPTSIVEIEECAFFDCKNLSNIVIPNSVEYIGQEAFCNCRSLRYIELPNEILTIEYGTFMGCVNLERIKLPMFLNRIEFEAFKDCTNLKNIVLPSTVESLSGSIFENCSCLYSIVLPDSICDIGPFLFENCLSLSYVELSNNIAHIEENVFENCINLKKVKIGPKINELEEKIFGDNPNLIIEGYAGSYIGQYAYENGYKFVTLDEVIIQDEYVEIKGDIDNIPVGSTLVIEEDKEKSLIVKNQVQANNVCTYDIEIKNNDEILNVDSDVVVKIKLPDHYDPAKCKVYYVDNDGNLISMCAIYENGYMIFTTNHFSAYAIVEHQTVFGDVNGDKTVNNKDLVALFKYVSNLNVQIDINRMDTNGDGVVNNKDITRLFQYLSKYNVDIY